MELPPRARRILLRSLFQLGVEGTTSACAENTRPHPHGETKKWNYLRVRGEYSTWVFEPRPFGELPPRARRIPGNQSFDRAQNGTTSACAENTPQDRDGVQRYGNYLRVRGEYGKFVHAGFEDAELPPRARRIRSDNARVEALLGTTSACAENTPTLVDEIAFGRNYLRVRGEYIR